jgi:hypothetical protein
MKRLIGLFIGIALSVSAAHAQYYYKDLVLLGHTQNRFESLKKEKVKKVQVLSYNGQDAQPLAIEQYQKISYKPDILFTYTEQADRGASWLNSYFQDGLLSRVVDSTLMSVNRTWYKRDAQQRIQEIETISSGDGITMLESHFWFYDQQGKPNRMLRVRNLKDTTSVRFVLDEKGMVVEEHAVFQGVELPPVYYYYDDQNRLTDIVRYNGATKKLLPFYIFEYEDGRLSGSTMVPEGSNEYQKWYFQYTDGLKAADFCYDKRGQLLGKVLYQYE